MAISLIPASLFLVVLYYLWKNLQIREGFPPGPLLPLPILNKIPFTRYWGLTTLDVFDEVKACYGPIYSIHLGHKRVVIIADIKEVKDVFARKITKRPEEVVNHWRDKRYGIIFSNGPDWRAQRKLFVSTSFGHGSVERTVNAVWPKMRDVALHETDVDWGEVSVKAFDRVLTEFLVYAFSSLDAFPGGRMRDRALDIFNISRFFGIQWSEFEVWFRFPTFRILAPRWSGYSLAHKVLQESHKELKSIVRYHQKKERKRDLKDKAKDFIDIYLEKLAEHEQEERNPLFKGESGIKCAVATLDNILVGGDGIQLTFYAILYILFQSKVRKEVLHKLGAYNPVNLVEDKERLPYCDAFLMEVQRFMTQAGFGAPHQVEGSESVQVGQYRVPPGVDVFPGVRHLLLDPGHWAKPREFCPERFINADGSTIKNDPYFLPFQIGPRTCPGRGFAMDAMFALLTRLVRDFRVEYGRRIEEPRKGILEDSRSFLPNLSAPAGDEDELELVGMALVQPKPFTVRFTELQAGGRDDGGAERARQGAVVFCLK